MKNPRWAQKEKFSINGQFVVHCTPQEQREIVRRIMLTPENYELCIAESLVKMTDWACEKTAGRYADANRAMAEAAIRICNEVEAESRKLDEEAERGAS